MTKNVHISGVGGWLGLLIVGLMILGPLLGAGKFYGEFDNAAKQFPMLANNHQWQNYKQVSFLIFITSVAINFAAGYRLWKIHLPESVSLAILALWLAGPLASVLIGISAIVILDSNPSGFTIGQIIGGTIPSFIAAGIWTAYLKRSARVKNTYKLPQPNISATPLSSEVSHIDE